MIVRIALHTFHKLRLKADIISVMSHPVILRDSSDSEPEYDSTSPTPISSSASTPMMNEEDPEEIPGTAISEEPEAPIPVVPIERPVTEIPLTTPISHHRGPRMRQTPRKQVRLPRVRPTPTAPARHDPKRARTDARRWSWMLDTLRQWRTEEGIPTTYVEDDQIPQGSEMTRCVKGH